MNASPAQTELFAAIVSGVGPGSVRRASITTPEPGWGFFHDDLLQLNLEGPDTVVGWWETDLVAGAFVDRSHLAGLPAIGVVARHYAETNTDGPSKHEVTVPVVPPTRQGVTGMARVVAAAAAATGAVVRELRILEPWGGALAVTIEVSDPAHFLNYRFRRFNQLAGNVWDEYPEGALLLVESDAGEVVYSRSRAERLGTFGYNAAGKYQGCDVYLFSRPAGWIPPPCPLDHEQPTRPRAAGRHD